MTKKTDELVRLIKELEGHDIYNPDDEADLTDREFLDVTDNYTREMIRDIGIEARKTLNDLGGRPDNRMINQVKRAGIRATDETITLEDGRYINYR